MMIQLHGGNCCGAKHIRGLGAYPDMLLSARAKLSEEETSFSPHYGSSNDMRTSNENPNKDFFNAKAPKESYKARLNRLIRFLKKHRPHHMVDVILSPSQVLAWEKVLLKIGFVAGPKWKNSNTTRTLQVFYLVY